MYDFSGKNVIVTGGSAGLGRGIAAAFTGAGARVLIMDISGRTDDIVREDGHAFGIRVDLADRKDLAAGFAKAMELFGGRLDVLVNCAGVQVRHEVEDFPLEDWDFVMEVNLNAVFELCQAAGRVMLGQGYGKIINVASMLSFFGGLRVPAYTASKGGVMQLTRALAVAWAGKNIQVNAIAPGYMATEMNTALIRDPVRSASILSRIPAGRWGTPEDVAGPVLFLASPAADYLSGAILPVDGGYLSC